ncbi:hypothetical protein L7F22_018137 [Adiantum nelumboides]|nr:hypothetical protein [Adiantum nelumboides]
MLRKERLVVNGKKNEFFMEEIHFLGHIVSKDRVRMDPAKIKAIQDWPKPVNLHEIRNFLGLFSYYRRFIRFFAEIATPLHDLMRKGVVFRFGERQQQAFKLVKEKLTTEPVFILPDLRKSFQVQCDACGSSIGAVLMQDGHVIAYENRVLRGPEKHMQIYEEELLAVIHALESWKHYLLGVDFIVQTDHQSLRYFLTQAKLSEKHLSWANFLSMFHFQLVHVAGKKNVVAKKVMTESHSPPYAGHRGIDSTIKALVMYFFWPSLRKDTESFVCSCLVCQPVKYDREKAYGLLQPLQIPTTPWESIAIDFIFGLPKTSSGNEGIWTIVDQFSKQAHFIPVWKQITVKQMTKIFLVTVFKYHGMPISIVSDRDPRMTGLFWRALWQNLHSTLRFSSSYHPQTDGQSEIVNSAVLDLLKCYVSDNPAQWEHYLSLVEFAYNNTIHSSTGKAPFEIVGGARKPPRMVKVMDDVVEADKFVEDLDLAYQQVQQAIQKAQEKQKKAADKHRRRLHFKEGDCVLLRFEKARLRKQKGKEKFNPKLRMRYYGPFQISEVINDVFYRY